MIPSTDERQIVAQAIALKVAEISRTRRRVGLWAMMETYEQEQFLKVADAAIKAHFESMREIA